MVFFMNKPLSIFLVFTMLLMVLPIAASAEDYSRDYPNIYNSGSPLWIHCEIQGMGEYVIVLDPNTNINAFGFDGPHSYNLINNTGSTIYGRAYDVNSSTAYNARWTSFYKLQLQTGTNQYGQISYEDYNIIKIYGTTMNLIDLNGDRGNDYYAGLPVEKRTDFIVHIAVACVEVILVVLLWNRRRCF